MWEAVYFDHSIDRIKALPDSEDKRAELHACLSAAMDFQRVMRAKLVR